MNDWLKSIWWIIVNVGFLILILLLSLIVFTVPAQSKDFIYVFLQDFEVDYIIAVYASLPFWCYITWYSACIILQIDPVKASLDRKEDERHVNRTLMIPKILGIIPCLILGYAIASTTQVTNNNHKIFHLSAICIESLIMWFAFIATDKFSSVKSNISSKSDDRNLDPYDHPKGFLPFLKYLFAVVPLGNWPSLKEVDIFKRKTGFDPSLAQELIFIAQFTGVRFFFLWLGSICLFITLLMCFPEANLFMSSWLRPGSILMLSLTGFTLLFTIIAYFHDYTRRPFGIVILILVIIFSYFNDNTSIPTLKNKNVSKRETVDKVFDNWIKIKKESWQTKHPDTDMPIIFIATQGGGIRGLTWTSRVFHNLDSTYTGFLDQTFVISGVSGGGVGATAYLSWMNDLQLNTNSPPSYQQFNNFTKRDFLSPLVASFTFADNLQRFLPVPIQSLERSKMLGRTWDNSYNECIGTGSFSKSFLGMWYDRNGFNYKIPSLILNGTLAENGQRVLTTNLKIAASQWFEDDIDFFEFTKRDITRSFASLNCSRFPFITSGGLVEYGGYKKGHVVDGGYRENTGLQSLLNVFCSIRERLRNEKGVRIVILYLQNGADECNNEVQASKVFQDFLVPLQGLIQVNGTGMPAKSVVQFVRQTFDRSIYANVDFYALSLEARDNDDIKLPLGWYMSDIVSKEIDNRISNIPVIDGAMTKTLKEIFPN
jgi:hypothetical protein